VKDAHLQNAEVVQAVTKKGLIMSSFTPMMLQYLEIKEKYKDCILFFRLGDFYEMFFEDAKTASKELEITLTGKDCGQEERAPMCGVPFHSADNYIAKLITKGYKVAICEQVEDPALAKGLVKRDVIRIVTPGTVIDSSMLDEKKNNYLVSIFEDIDKIGISAVDLSTGEFKTATIKDGNYKLKLIDELAKLAPSEIIANEAFFRDTALVTSINKKFSIYMTKLGEESYNLQDSMENGIFAEKVQDMNKISRPSLVSAGALIAYLEETQKCNLSHISSLAEYCVEEFMLLDINTRRNLELTETMREKSRKGTLLWVLDRTETSMGSRLIKKWIDQPLINIHDIKDRQDAIGELKDKFMVRMELKELFKKVYDIERLIGKVVLGSANCRDLVSLKNSLCQVPYIKATLKDVKSDLLVKIQNGIDSLEDVYSLIDSAVIDDPPITIKEGGFIKSLYNSELDKLKSAMTDGKVWLAELESKEREKTGIKNLKIGFNKVFGYYLEVTKSNLNQVPDYFIRKQTLSNCERYITGDLKEIEDTVLGAEEKVKELEYQLFIELRDKIMLAVDRIKNTAVNIAELDTMAALSEVADREGYVKPDMSENGPINIQGGRHPVVEKMLGRDGFVPNDTYLDMDQDRMLIITGPNMAGKSTYMRQVALIALMAQIGSFVPAESAEISIADRIFTRVGASDDLAAGQSTFMVEMSEVAYILNNATSKSLLILDEIGRGTSTFDGLSIAWSVIEYINDQRKVGARTLFATHYHELTELEGRFHGIKNYCVSVRENGEDIIFLRKIQRGGADGSYGIQVARLAGVPAPVIDRARGILSELEEADINKKEAKARRARRVLEGQVGLFEDSQQEEVKAVENPVVSSLKKLDLTKMTPIEAMNELYRLQGEALLAR